MRQSREGCMWFWDFVLSEIVGVKHYKKVAGNQLVREWCTATSEAFGYLVLENYSDGFDKPKWTKCQSAVRNGGWDNCGIKRFNELVRKVKEDRRSPEGKALEEEYRKLKDEKMKSKKRKRAEDVANFEAGLEAALDDLNDMVGRDVTRTEAEAELPTVEAV